MSRFFIDRPIFATVLAIVIMLAGLVAMRTLPTAQFPDIVPPQIKISTSYSGANAETVAKTVAAPLEQQVNGADYMIYMNSQNSSNGDLLLNVFFEVGTDLNTVLTDVTNRANLANPQLPEDVRRNGVNIQKSTPNILLVVAVQSDGRYDLNYLNNYASINVLDELKRIPGANQAAMFGTPDYAMRVWLRPDRMAEKGVTVNDIRNAIKEQNAQFPAGKIGQTPTAEPVELTFAVNTRGRFSEPEEFENIILRANPDGSTLRIKDIGRVELGARSYDVDGRLDGKSMALILVYQQAGANALDVAEQVRAKMEELKQNFPDGVSYAIPYDTTEFVKLSIEEVIHTFFEALVLVVLVVYLFLQNWRATLIPCLVVPVSIVGAFAGMYLLGFSINTLTLFGMVLAIGIVVDDAIVVIENVERNMAEFKLDPKEAARRAMDEVTGPVIAIVLVLCAVFIPSAFLGGITGQMYKQFAVTIAISVVISGLMALTLTPALAGVLLKPSHGKKFVFFQWFDRGFEWLTGGYVAGAAWLVKRSLIALLLFGGLLFLTWHMFRIVPTGFVPDEDQGYVIALALLPDGASLDRTTKVTEQISAIAHKNPAVNEVLDLSGYSTLDGLNKPNAATLFITLKPWKERETPDLHAFQVVRDLQRATAQAVGDARVLVFNPPAIPGLGATAGFEFWLQNRGEDNPAKLAEALQTFLAKARQRPELTELAATFNANSQQLFVDLDRDKARALGINVNDVFDLLQGLFGTVYVNDFNKLGRTFRVLLQAEPEYRTRPDDINQVYVRSSQGGMVPLSTLVQLRYVTGPDIVSRFNVFPAARINGGPAPRYSSGQAITAMEQVAREALPDSFSYAWAGQAFQEKRSGASSAIAFVFGMIMVFLILAAQYEKWSLPLSVIIAVPFGLVGALAAVWLRGLTNDVYFQIGLVTLVALAAKNAILIVEFAVLKHEEGMAVREAALEAARLRFRPILMTSLAFILGCVPLAVSSGAGAASRHSIGTGVIGGMLGATVLAIFFVPVFYLLLSGGRKPATVAPEPAASAAAPTAAVHAPRE